MHPKTKTDLYRLQQFSSCISRCTGLKSLKLSPRLANASLLPAALPPSKQQSEQQEVASDWHALIRLKVWSYDLLLSRCENARCSTCGPHAGRAPRAAPGQWAGPPGWALPSRAAAQSLCTPACPGSACLRLHARTADACQLALSTMSCVLPLKPQTRQGFLGTTATASIL